MDIHCAVQKDLQFLQISNHMHDWGTTTVTDFVDPQGVTHVFKDDVNWSGDLALNPNFTKFPLEAPRLGSGGQHAAYALHLAEHHRCVIEFPTEMCVFFGFVLSDNDIYCNDGKWSEAQGASSRRHRDRRSDGGGYRRQRRWWQWRC